MTPTTNSVRTEKTEEFERGLQVVRRTSIQIVTDGVAFETKVSWHVRSSRSGRWSNPNGWLAEALEVDYQTDRRRGVPA